METATVDAQVAPGLAARTVADLLPVAARNHATRDAVLYKEAGSDAWASRTFAEVGEIVHRLERRRDLDRGADRAWGRPRLLRVGGALALGDARRHLHVHLHVGHHRAAEGLRDLARQLPGDGRHGGLAERPGAGEDHVPVPP